MQALDGLYARGAELSDPLGKDYRAAMSTHDYPRALQITRAKLQLNPADADARAELDRLNNKLFQTDLQELREALSRREEAAILSALDAIEELASLEKLERTPEYTEARALRDQLERQAAMESARALLGTLPARRADGAWREISEALARIHALESEHGFDLGADTALERTELQRYVDAQRLAADETARFQKAARLVEEVTARIEGDLLAGTVVTLPQAKHLQRELHQHWTQLEWLPGAIAPALTDRVQAVRVALRARLLALQRRRDFKVAAGVVAMVAVAGVAAWFGQRALRASGAAQELATLRSAGQVEVAEQRIAALRSDQPNLAARPKLHAAIDETERWAREERLRQAQAEERVARLETEAANRFSDREPDAIAADLESTEQLVAALPAGLRASTLGRLNAVQSLFAAALAGLREKQIAQADAELPALEKLAAEKLTFDQQPAAIAAALREIQPTLHALEARARPALQALELPAPQQARVDALRRQVDVLQGELAALQQLDEKLLGVASIEAYWQTLAGLKDSRLTQAPAVRQARKLLAARPSADDLMARLLMPGDRAGWAAAKEGVAAERFAPEKVEAGEIAKLLALREDSYLNDIWEVTVNDFTRKGGPVTMWSRGEVVKDGPHTVGSEEDQTTSWSGAFYDPSVRKEIPAFVTRTFVLKRARVGSSGTGEVTASRLSAVSRALARLELNRMTDESGTKYEKPLLRVFDALVADPDASPLFKAFLMQQLAALLNTRPTAWGLHFCPSLRGDLARLQTLCEDIKLHSEDWLLDRKREQFGPVLAPFFAELQTRNYFAEAQAYRATVRAALGEGLHFGGFLDGEMHARTTGGSEAGVPLWALTSADLSVARLRFANDSTTAAAPADAAFAAYSPIIFLPIERSRVRVPGVPFLEP